jgi:hypothetical protein
VSAEIIELPVHPADPASQLIYPSAECNQTGANCAKSLGRPLQGSRPFHLGESSDRGPFRRVQSFFPRIADHHI